MYKWECTRAKINYSNIITNPNRFELDINYRSHNGILQLASSVINLIWDFFPNSIDQLSREHSKVGGPRPTFFDGFQKEHLSDRKRSELDDVCTSNKQRRVDSDENPFIEFGADQVIIVRNDEAKMQVKKLINKAGLVMTVFETKGMEFNDVILYNFFTDSPARRKVILYRIFCFRSSYR
jgi:ATP-dependent exoDNAse (exonuclease V) beta subunit